MRSKYSESAYERFLENFKARISTDFFSTDLEHCHKVWAFLASQTTKLSYHSNYKAVGMLVHTKTY